MEFRIHPHAEVRMTERGVTLEDVRLTVEGGERFEAKRGRTGFRRNLAYDAVWRSRTYAVKQVEAIAVPDGDGWLVITVLAKYF